MYNSIIFEQTRIALCSICNWGWLVSDWYAKSATPYHYGQPYARGYTRLSLLGDSWAKFAARTHSVL